MNTGRKGIHKIKGKPTLRQILDYYDAWLREERSASVARALNVQQNNLDQWPLRHPEFALAKKLADERRDSSSTFSGYVYKSLSADARKAWDQIQFWMDYQSSAQKIDSILSPLHKRIRQELFVHALIHSGFDISEACRMVAISRATLEKWRQTDFGFRQLVEEIQLAKKDFFERQLVSLVEMGHPGAVIFVNRTVNADRGYGERLKIEPPSGIDIDRLDLDMETRKKILEAIRRAKEEDEDQTQRQLPAPSNGKVVDVEAEVVEE